MEGVPLKPSKQEKDLGVLVDQNLNFSDHVTSTVNKASKLLGLIKRTFPTLSMITVPKLFKTLVRPHLEYGNAIWHPKHKRHQLQVEKVQRRATEMIPELKCLPYEDRLQTLKLPSLMHRRRRGDMI